MLCELCDITQDELIGYGDEKIFDAQTTAEIQSNDRRVLVDGEILKTEETRWAPKTGKMATYCEAKEHGKEPDASQLVNEVLPDLLIHALQIANYYQVDLGQKYEERIRCIIDRFNKSQSSTVK